MSVVGLWDRARGEAVGFIGLLGDILADAGVTLGRWSNRRALSKRECAEADQDGGE